MSDPTPVDTRVAELLDCQEREWRAGRRVTVGELVGRYRSVADRPDALLDLVHNEIFLRRERGESPRLDEYQSLYPGLADALRIQWEVDEFLFSDAAAGPPPPGPHPPVRRIGRYEVRETLGQGGIGVVYKVWDPQLKRVAAVKLLRSGRNATPDELARFRTEAEAVARVRHPNVVQVFDVGDADGEPFLGMEYCGGGTLAERLRGGPLGPREAAAVVRQVAEGIAAAHRTHVVHRDLKPANVFLEPDPSGSGTGSVLAKVSDFGLAKLLDSDSAATHTGMILGTPAYMAPEQAFGKPAAVGPAADVYAAGAVLYECLTGRPPFGGATTAAVLDQLRLHDPAPVRRTHPHVPADLDTIARHCLRKDPLERYPSMAALAEDLGRFLAGKPILARPVGPVGRARRWCGRNPAAAALAGIVFGLLVALAGVLGLGNMRLTAALTQARDAEREARLREAEALVGEAHGTRYSRRNGQRFAALAALKKAAAIGRELGQPPGWFDRLRNEAVAALALADLHVTRSWPGWPQGAERFAVSADWTVYARSDRSGAVSVRRMADDAEVAALPGTGRVGLLALSPDGKALAQRLLAVGRLRMWDLAAGPPQLVLDLDGVESVEFMNDGGSRLLLVLYENGTLGVHDAATGGRRATYPPVGPGRGPRGAILRPHPTRPLVAISSYYARPVVVRDVRTGAVVWNHDPPWPNGSPAAWHPGGELLCVSNGDTGEIRLYRFAPGTGTFTFERPFGKVGHGDPRLLFHPRGDRLFVVSWDDQFDLYDFHTGRLLCPSTIHFVGGWPPCVSVSPAGDRVAFAGATGTTELGVWSVADGREYRRVGPAERGHWVSPRVATHPGGRLVVQSYDDGLHVFELATGRELAVLPFEFPEERSHETAAGFDARGRLYTNNFAGAFRWPYGTDPARPGVVRFGPPERLPFHPGDRPVAASDDGSVVAQTMFAGYGMQEHTGGWVLHPAAAAPRWVSPKQSRQGCSVSPDGRWVSFDSDVYEAATGRHVYSAIGNRGISRFSRDGTLLLTHGRPVAAGSWEPLAEVHKGGLVDCSPDNTLGVLTTEAGVFRLVALATGRELAVLEDPDRFSGNIEFTPDGTKLVAAAADGLRVWDLRRIRAALQDLELDWDAPPYPSEPTADPGPLAVEFVGAERTVRP